MYIEKIKKKKNEIQVSLRNIVKFHDEYYVTATYESTRNFSIVDF